MKEKRTIADTMRKPLTLAERDAIEARIKEERDNVINAVNPLVQRHWQNVTDPWFDAMIDSSQIEIDRSLVKAGGLAVAESIRDWAYQSIKEHGDAAYYRLHGEISRAIVEAMTTRTVENPYAFVKSGQRNVTM